MSKFKNKYGVESTRLKDWDYTNAAWYYVTINTKNHIEWFGEIIKGEMVLNKFGVIVNEEWLKTKEIRTDVDLDEYVVMPNHMHGIIILENNGENSSSTLQSNSLGSIIGQIKSVCSKKIKNLGYHNFKWQDRFHDRIIRNEKELYQIRGYIRLNPLKWHLEKENPDNFNWE